MRWRRVLAVVGLLVLAPLAGAFVPRPLLAPPLPAQGETRRILVLANPIHTDIALPADPDVIERFGFLADAGVPIFSPSVKWLVVGWGGRAFYLETPTWSELKPGPVFSALTLDRAVMHVDLGGGIEPGAEGVTPVDLSPGAFANLLQATLDGFARDAEGMPQLIEGRSYGEYDRFYEGNGRFNALVGCNTWTSAVLRRGGLRTGWWNPLPQSLAWSLKLYNDLPQGVAASAASASQP